MRHPAPCRQRLLPLALPLAIACAFPAHAVDTLREVVVTAPAMEAPLTVVTDPRAPRYRRSTAPSTPGFLYHLQEPKAESRTGTLGVGLS